MTTTHFTWKNLDPLLICSVPFFSLNLKENKTYALSVLDLCNNPQAFKLSVYNLV